MKEANRNNEIKISFELLNKSLSLVGFNITCSNRAAGIPTILLRPITTALFPLIETLYLCSSSMHPFGVQGTNRGSLPRMASRPIFNG